MFYFWLKCISGLEKKNESEGGVEKAGGQRGNRAKKSQVQLNYVT